MLIRSIVLAAAASAACALPASAAPVVAPSVRFDGAGAGDRTGTSVAAAGDVNGDGHGDLVIGAPGAAPNADGTAAGAAFVVLGPFTPGTTVDLAAGGPHVIRLSGSGAEAAGRSVAGAGDVNGDGLADVIVGAPTGTPGQEGPQSAVGRAYVVFGSRAPHDVDLAHLGAGGVVLQGASHEFPDAFGWDVAALGDIDHDGHADVAVAAPGNPGFEQDFTRGRAYVVFGRREPGRIKVAHTRRAVFRIGLGTAGSVTSVAAAGDWNGDGHRDIAVLDGHAVSGRGAVYVVYGHRRDEPVRFGHLGHDGVAIEGPYLHFQLGGAELAGGRDVDGDHRPDLVIGTPAAHSSALRPPAGGVWVVRGARSRATVDLRDPGTRAWELARGARGSITGAAVDLARRIGGSDRPDLVTLSRRSLLVLYGTPSRGTLQLAEPLPASRGFTIDGPALEPPLPPTPLVPDTEDTAGFTTAAAAGDLGGDGRGDLLAGAAFASHQGRTRAGAAYLFFTPGA